jgi:signal transduction histidine kinase
MFLAVLGLFAFLIFRSLSSRLTESVLEQSRAEAETIAQKLASSGSGPPFRVTERTRETESYLHSVLKEKSTVEYITVTDREGHILFEGRSEGRRTFLEERPTSVDLPDGTGRRTTSTERDYDIAVPIENIGFLHVGVSKEAVAGRLEALRADLVKRTAFAGAVALVALAVSDALLWWLLERNRRLELERLENRRLSDLGALAAGLAHEIRNPLHAIGLSLQNLQGQLPSEARRLAGAQAEVRRLDRLVDDFLLYARPAPLKLENFSLPAFLTQTITLVTPEATERGVRVREANPPDVTVRWDEGKVRQVLWNLLRNAMEAASADGRRGQEVTLSAGLEARDRIALKVEDRGPGIVPDVLARLPSLFYTTKKGGSGLGLMVASRIAKEHGGDLQIASRSGAGTVVTVTLPRSAEETARTA